MKTSRLIISLSLLLASMPAQAAFIITLVNPPAVFGDNNNIDNINEGEGILASPPAGSTTFITTTPNINLATNSIPGFVDDDFVLTAAGFVDVIGGTSGTFTLNVNSDDGFRLRRNGVTVLEAILPKGPSDVNTPVLLTDGDRLDLSFFERGGGEVLRFTIGNNAGALVGDSASGILIITIPEPMMPSLLGFGAIGLLAQRRRRKA